MLEVSAIVTLIAGGPRPARSRTVAAATRENVMKRLGLSALVLVMAAGVALPAVWRDLTAIILSGLLVGGTFMVITMAAIQEARAIAGPQPVGLLSASTVAL